MNEQEQFNKKLEEIRKDLLIEVSQWWGHKYSGYKGTIITNSKEVYEYQYYHIAPESLDDESRYIRKTKSIDDEGFQKICKFIEDEIMNKQFQGKSIMDAGYNVIVNYNGCKNEIKNNKGYGNNIEIFDIAQELINKIIK